MGLEFIKFFAIVFQGFKKNTLPSPDILSIYKFFPAGINAVPRFFHGAFLPDPRAQCFVVECGLWPREGELGVFFLLKIPSAPAFTPFA